MSYMPCKNPNCHSFGKPHPNCKCYGGMAAGGEVEAFCSKDRPHDEGCEYFAGGGVAGLPEGFQLEDSESSAFQTSTPSSPPPGLPQGFQLQDEQELPQQEMAPNVDEAKYGTPGQQLATVGEGLAEGVAGPLAPLAEMGLSKLGVPGMTAEDIKGRQATNPVAHGLAETAGLVGGLMTGSPFSEAGLASKITAKVGSNFLKNAIQAGAFQVSDEASKWALGQGDPQDPVGAAMAIGVSSVLGGFLGSAGGLLAKGASKGLANLAEQKFGQQAISLLHGIAAAAKSQDPMARQEFSSLMEKSFPDLSQKAFKAGQKIFDNLGAGTGTIGAAEGYRENGLIGAAEGFAKGAATGFLGKKAAGVIGSKIVAPTLMKILSSGTTEGAANAFDQMWNAAKGSEMVNRSLEPIFKLKPTIGQQAVNAYGSEKLKKDLDEWISNGGHDEDMQQQIYEENGASDTPQGYAEGGEVKSKKMATPDRKPLLADNDGVALHYPEQNILMSAARGRISNYLSSLRPHEHAPKLPFDEAPDNKQQKKSYDRALSVAVAPLSVMDEIRKGTIEPEHIKHLNSMYPELSGLLKKRMTENIVKAQMDGKKPSYAMRQGLSMMLETPLSGEMTPANIVAAQSVFAKQAAQSQSGPAPGKTKGSSSTLSKSDQAYMTGPQALVRRSQKL